MNEERYKKCGKGLSVWLIPEGSIRRDLSELIFFLSLKYKTPCFKPHITLIGGLSGEEGEIVSKTAELASQIKFYEAITNGIEHSQEYFKSLFLKIKKTEEVVNANLKAREIFRQYPENEYFPHLSLMYSNCPEELKEKFIEQREDRLYFGFDVKSMYLFSTKGRVEDWYEIKRFELGGSGSVSR